MKTDLLRALFESHLTYPSRLDYQQSKIDSEHIDLALGFEIDPIEKRLLEKEVKKGKAYQSWSNLNPQAFQTPYSEWIELIELLNPTPDPKTWVDLGSAYGRLAFVLSAYAPQSRFIGYEASIDRVLEAKRVAQLWEIDPTTHIHQDLVDPHFSLIPADIYFIYDFGNMEAIRKIIEDLRGISRSHSIQLIARGLGIQNEIDRHCPWLTVQNPIRLKHSTIYRN